MRTTFILPGHFTEPIGGVKTVYEYANELVSLGHDVTIVHPKALSAPRSAGEWFRARTWRLKTQLLHGGTVPWFDVDPRVDLKMTSDLRSQHVPDADAVVAT